MSRQIRAVGFLLTSLIIFSLVISPVTGQSQDNRQPSPDNTSMYLWGDASLANGNCVNHFSNNDSSEFGFGEYDSTENIDFSCQLDVPLLEEMFLDPNGVINFQLGFLIQSSENSGGDELTISFNKGNEVLAQQEFLFPTFSNEQISWEIAINENMSYWEEGSVPQLQIQFNKPAPTALECLDPQKALARCEAKFRIYYADNNEGLNVEGLFPILEPSDPAAVNPNDEVEDDDTLNAMSVGDGSVSILLLSPWFIAIFVLVGFISLRREKYQLGMVLEEKPVENQSELSSSEGETLVDSYRARVFTLCALYVAQGIPWGFMTVTFVTFLAVKGVEAGELAFLLTLGTLPWSLKFLWGPIIDRFQYREMGRRRPWILIAQTGMIIALASILFVPNPSSDLTLIASMFLVYNIFTSLQDVSTDALAVDVLKPNELEKVNSYMFTAKSVGGIIGGAGFGVIIGYVGIKGAIVLQIPILIGIMLVPLFIRERPGEKMFPWSENNQLSDDKELEEGIIIKEIISKVKTAFSLRSAQLGIALSIVMSLSSFLIPVLPLLFVRELGWSEVEFNATKGGIILVITMIGYLIGGQLGNWFGGKSVLIYSALVGAVLSAIWGISESMWSSSFFMMTIWSLHTFAWSMVAINIYSLMMKVTWGEVGGTQFTGYMAMMNLSAIIGYQLTEPLASRFDYSTLFLISAVLETVVIIAALYIDPDETRRTLEKPSQVVITTA